MGNPSSHAHSFKQKQNAGHNKKVSPAKYTSVETFFSHIELFERMFVEWGHPTPHQEGGRPPAPPALNTFQSG
jgi:hypothetical protein